MITKEEEFLKRLQAMFQVEAEEHMSVLSAGIIELEKNPQNAKSMKLIETMFREAHSLKGAARSVSRNDIESMCQALESLFADLKNKRIHFTAGQFDLVHQSLSSLSTMISRTGTTPVHEGGDAIRTLRSITKTIEPGATITKHDKAAKRRSKPGNGKATDTKTRKKEPARAIGHGVLSVKKESAPTDAADEKPAQRETVRIQTSKLDPLFLQAEQMIQSKIAAVQRTVELKNIGRFIGAWKSELRKLEARRPGDNEVQVKEIIHWTNELLDETERSILGVTDAVEGDQRSLGRMIDDHVESMKNILMLPVSTISEVFPRLVRDLSRSEGKEVEFIAHGNEIEVDKRILQELKDPLIHLLRNCIDHGIEKPNHGTITLSFEAIDGRNLEIRLSDTGAGIDVAKVIAAAVKAGVVSKESAATMSRQEAMDLIFKSGISTSSAISDISGRGLGLAIVREKVESLGGKVFVESQPDHGTTFRLVLPLALSTVHGVLVKTAGHSFIIPTGNVERALRVKSEEISTVEQREMISIDQELVWIVKLGDVLGFHQRVKAPPLEKEVSPLSPHFIHIVVLTQGSNRIGFRVDEILDEHQILVKSLGRQLQKVRNISGAAVLGSGKVVPVIHVSDLMKSAMGSLAMNTTTTTTTEGPAEAKGHKVLVTDDSVTSRTLLQNILEIAGYDVITAVDGVDAVTKARAGEFDLIVSDVDMPRMNGFELTAKLRKDRKLSEVPVVLVTSLESTEDREHGMDVGANAYIAKSDFDQSGLLEVIAKLLSPNRRSADVNQT
ncbi:MAG: response regulator [Bacteroidota bacterium]